MKNLKFWLGMTVSVILIWWAFSQVEIDKLGEAITNMNLYWFVACVPVYFLQYVIRAIRWKFLLAPIRKIPYSSRIASTVIGFTGNMLLPARLGEIIRAIDLGQRENLPKSSVLATILLERIFDGLAVMPLFLGSAWLLGVFESESNLSKATTIGAGIFAGIYLVVIVAVIVLAIWPDRSISLFRTIFKFLPSALIDKLCVIMESVSDGLMMIKDLRLLFTTASYTIILWLMLSLPLFFLSFGVGFPVSYKATLFVSGLTVLFIAIPSSPGFVGTMHAAILFGFSDFLGMPEEKAFAVAIVTHGGTFIFTILYCLKFLIKGQVSLFDLNKQAQENS